MSTDPKSDRQLQAARKIAKKRRKALAVLGGKTPDPKFEKTMTHADEVMRRFANAYKDLAKR
jgi:hypothetical protein